jgi:hypothetical protein
MLEKLRKDDFLYGYWLGIQGWTIWLVDRCGELFLHMQRPAIGDRPPIHIWDHFPRRDENHSQAEVIFRSIGLLLGFTEFAFYGPVNRMDAKELEKLTRQFDIHDAMIAEWVKAQGEVATAQEPMEEAVEKADEQPNREPCEEEPNDSTGDQPDDLGVEDGKVVSIKSGQTEQ